MSPRSSLLMTLVLALLATGCQSTRFYTQAVSGQWEILVHRRSIDGLLKSADTPVRLRRELRLIKDLTAFAASELHLPGGGEFSSYADIGRPYVVWNIHAAPAFSVEAKTWWYPLVGRLEYQGYFKKQMAMDYARKLRRQGFDVFTAGVTAYSTLGWFDDPVLNTFVDEPEGELADLIFHELAHRRLFIPGDTDFNEAFASSVAREGVQRWLRHRHDSKALAEYLDNRRTEDELVARILSTRKRLENLYASARDLGPADLIARKSAILESLRDDYQMIRRDHPEYHDYDEWMAAPINNAQLNTIDTYYQLMPGFAARLHELHDDLGAFYQDVAAMRHINKVERREILAAARARLVKPGVLPDEPENHAMQQGAQGQHQPESPSAGFVPEQKVPDPAAQKSAGQVH